MTSSYLEVQALTWEKDTHDLFDYETKSVHKSLLKVTTSCCIFRENLDCYILDSEPLEGSVSLLKIQQKSTDFEANLVAEKTTDKMWLVVRGIKNSQKYGYKLSEGDWLKMGRVRLRVQKIVLKPEKAANNMPSLFQHFEGEGFQHEFQENNPVEGLPCRICLSETACEADPLICPCKCSGTMKYVHLNCLKEWIKSKVASRITEKAMSLYLKDLSCELCNTALPSFITCENQQISLVAMNFPNKNYIVFEEFRPEKKQKQGLHIISLDPGEFGNIGRGHDCDIKISDISVSRKHCKVKLQGDSFYIEDLKSKFGTLVKLGSSFVIKNNTDITIQISRTVLHLVYKQKWKHRCCCFGSEKVAAEGPSHITQTEAQLNQLVNASNRNTIPMNMLSSDLNLTPL